MTSGRSRPAAEADAGDAQDGIDYASFFPEENLLDALLSSEDEDSDPGVQDNDATQRTRQHAGSDAVASPGMSVAGRKVGRLQMMKLQAAKPSTSHVSQEDSWQPIAQRTRATRVESRLPAPDVDLDDVLFDIDNEEMEEIENFGKVFDDDEEYQKVPGQPAALSRSRTGCESRCHRRHGSRLLWVMRVGWLGPRGMLRTTMTATLLTSCRT